MNQRDILVVEDDRKISSLVGIYLQREGFRTRFAYDGASALDLLTTLSPALIILDLMLPSIDGWQVCQKVRERSNVPILILTARGEEAERVLGLTLGADDYVVKPFSPRELMERVKAILRRVKRERANQNGGISKIGELCIDNARRKVTVSGISIALTPSEYRLLTELVSAPGRVFSREQLLRCLYPSGEEVVERVVDVHIGKLRQKIEVAEPGVRLIETVRGIGYRLIEDGGD